jgi:hypothetical protein
MEHVHYNYKSRLINWVLLITILPIYLVSLVVIFPLRDTNTLLNYSLLIIFLILIMGLFILLFTKLNLSINNTEVRYSFFPFKTGFIRVDDITSYDVLSINVIKEFNGWGLKNSKNFGKGYLTQGNSVLVIDSKLQGKFTFSIGEQDINLVKKVMENVVKK